MAVYVMSDLHGNYEGFMSILEQIHFYFPPPFLWFIVKDKRVSRFVLIPQKICFMIFSLPASKISLFSLPFHTFWSVFFLCPKSFFPFFVLFFDISPLTYKRTPFSHQYTVSEIISPNFYKFFCRVFFCAHRHSHFSAHKHYILW